MAATARQRQKAAGVLRDGGTQKDAAEAAGAGLSTAKRWLDQPAFRAMVTTSADIHAGAPARMNGRVGAREPLPDERSPLRALDRHAGLIHSAAPGGALAGCNVLSALRCGNGAPHSATRAGYGQAK